MPHKPKDDKDMKKAFDKAAGEVSGPKKDKWHSARIFVKPGDPADPNPISTYRIVLDEAGSDDP